MINDIRCAERNVERKGALQSKVNVNFFFFQHFSAKRVLKAEVSNLQHRVGLIIENDKAIVNEFNDHFTQVFT